MPILRVYDKITARFSCCAGGRVSTCCSVWPACPSSSNSEGWCFPASSSQWTCRLFRETFTDFFQMQPFPPPPSKVTSKIMTCFLIHLLRYRLVPSLEISSRRPETSSLLLTANPSEAYGRHLNI